jgi:hypothetical protein
MKHIATLTTALGSILTLALSLCACVALPSMGGDSWKEEVLLHDGQKIVVQRSQSYGGRSEPGQSGPIKEHTIRFTLPGASQTVTWTSDYGEDLGRTNFNLLAVHVLDGTPYVVVKPNLCLSYNKWGRPNPPYVFFKLEGSAWQRIPLEQLPAEFKTINVVRNTLGRDAQTLTGLGMVPVEKVKEMNASSNPADRSILREALPNEGRSCPAMVSYGKTGGWIGLDWFTDQPSLEVCLKFCYYKKVSTETCPCNSIFKGEK